MSESLTEASLWCNAEFKKRWESQHPSFLAEQLLEEAAEKFNIEHHGVEGWLTSVAGATGIAYLNMGDPYVPTLCVVTDRVSARFTHERSGWSHLAAFHPAK